MTNSDNFNENEEFNLDETSAYSVEIPDFKPVNLKRVYDYDTMHVDFEDLSDLNKQITAARVALLKLTEQINKYERLARAAKTKYDREYRRAYVNSNEKSAGDRKIRAEIICEGIENDYLYYDQLQSELNRSAYAMRQELQALNSAGNNLRQQLKTV